MTFIYIHGVNVAESAPLAKVKQILRPYNSNHFAQARGHRYLSFINNIHSAAEQKNDFFFTLMGMGCSNLISAMRLTVSSGPKVPFTTSRLFQR